MRLHIKTSKSKGSIDFNYQLLLTGCVQKWLGKDNEEHGKVSLYSFSWLHNVNVLKTGVQLKDGSSFFLSFHSDEPAKRVLKNILQEPEMFAGARVIDITIEETPLFSSKEHFFLGSPILIKKHDNNKEKHYTFMDEESNQFMTDTLKAKATHAGLITEGVKVYFDREYLSPKTKVVAYRNIKNKVNICPIIVEGPPEVVAFAWNVGIGNSTGIGFGALK